jgi:integrase/recombinase XerD
MTQNQEVTIIEERGILIPSPPPQRTERGYSIEAIIGGWIDEQRAAKTKRDYKATILDFRSLLQAGGYDLLFPSDEGKSIDFVGIISDAAQLYQRWRSPKSRHSGPVSEATQARRLHILSSFYKYCIRKRHLKREINPLETVKKPQIEAYAGAQPISSEELERRLRAIPRHTEEGAQALAFLSVALTTGRRAAELQHLRRRDVQIIGKSIKLDFPHAKGDKHMRDLLTPEVSIILAQWLDRFYHGEFWKQPGDAPLWVHIYHDSKRGEALGYHALSNIVYRYLGTKKQHVTRHSFAFLMDKAGASAKDIKERLGHSNIATTDIYMSHLKNDENAYAPQLAELLGLSTRRR